MFKANGISWTFYIRPLVTPGHVIVLKVTENQYSVFGHNSLPIVEQINAISMFIKKEREKEKMKTNAHNN